MRSLVDRGWEDESSPFFAFRDSLRSSRHALEAGGECHPRFRSRGDIITSTDIALNFHSRATTAAHTLATWLLIGLSASLVAQKEDTRKHVVYRRLTKQGRHG